ncbi:MAG TPA: ferrochelatase [Acidimicrobiales bacterium]|nr:ferrochelatase [Acidimicrobiales bacterium]
MTRPGGGGPDATGVLVMAHGTPRSVEEIDAFYTEIRRGRAPTAGQLAELTDRYRAIGGTSPLNERTRAQVAGIARALEGGGTGRFVVVGGAKFAAPRIEEAVADLRAAGVRRIVGLVLAPHSSSVSVGEYDRRARQAVGSGGTGAAGGIEWQMIDHWYDAPGFEALMAGRVRRGLDDLVAQLSARRSDSASGGPVRVLFSAHSVPVRVIEAGDNYGEQLASSARSVAGAAGVRDWSVAWQSAGRTDDEWLGPDINAVIGELPGLGYGGVLVCPIGFVSDHLEVLYDIDIEAAATAEKAGIALARTASLNDDPLFCALLADVVREAAGHGRHTGAGG